MRCWILKPSFPHSNLGEGVVRVKSQEIRKVSSTYPGCTHCSDTASSNIHVTPTDLAVRGMPVTDKRSVSWCAQSTAVRQNSSIIPVSHHLAKQFVHTGERLTTRLLPPISTFSHYLGQLEFSNRFSFAHRGEPQWHPWRFRFALLLLLLRFLLCTLQFLRVDKAQRGRDDVPPKVERYPVE